MLKQIFLTLTFIFLFSISSLAQRFIAGSVTEIVDGKTVVIQVTSGNSMTVQLQAIEVPEPEQQLHTTVKEHLQKLLLRKNVKILFVQMAQGKMIGKLYLNDVDVSIQMLRDGAAWYNMPESNLHNQTDRENYQAMESAAKNEKLGVWGIQGLKPSWEFRLEKEEARKRQTEAEMKKAEEKYNAESKVVKQTPLPKYELKISLPNKIPKVTYIKADDPTPKGFVVIGIGFLPNNQENLVKAIKKPESGDMPCQGHSVPSTYIVTRVGLSNLCPYSGYGDNANYIENVAVLSKIRTKDALNKAYLAYRMYKISGNRDVFTDKANDAIEAIVSAVQILPAGNFSTYLLYVGDAYRDCLRVKASRHGAYGAKLSGDALIGLNDKYNLGNVSESYLDDEIFKVGVSYLEKALNEAKRIGIKKQSLIN